VFGLLTVTKFAVAKFNPAGGAVINISSLSALGNAPVSAVYSASKAGVNAITKVLALELAERNIRVNAIMPGYFDTEGARATGVKVPRGKLNSSPPRLWRNAPAIRPI
jgi:3-oxoacyl-[acyl-carrier protein] reductase